MVTVPIVVEKHYKLVLWLLPRMAEFPKDQRFLLADRIERELLDVLDRLIEAVYMKDKGPLLQRANLSLEKSRFLMRMAKDMQYVSLKRYDYFSRGVNEIGRMVGGWQKSQISEAAKTRAERVSGNAPSPVSLAGNQDPGVYGCRERGG